MTPVLLVGGLLLAFILLFGLLLFLFWRLWFCRLPDRDIPSGERLIVSPANGHVAVVRRFDTTHGTPGVAAKKWNRGRVELLATDVATRGWFILIVMTPLNVHHQRAPVAGRVVSTLHVPGRFHNAVKDPASLLTLENERNEILLERGSGVRRRRVKVVQIAGVLARRILCPLAPDQKVEKGEVIGFINLGSQVALLLPEDISVKVKVGETVIDGETVLGEWR